MFHDDPSRYAGVSPTAAPLRPLLHLLQPFWLDGSGPGPSGRRGRGRPTCNQRGLLYLVVDDTAPLHKRGKHVYGLGWFRDAVASTAKRVATAGGNHWVVVGLAICIPRNHQDLTASPSTPGQVAPGPQEPEERSDLGPGNAPRYPGIRFPIGVPGSSRRWGLFDEESAWRSRLAVTDVGVMPADAAIYDPMPPEQSKGKRGSEGEKGAASSQSEGALKKAEPTAVDADLGFGKRSEPRPMA